MKRALPLLFGAALLLPYVARAQNTPSVPSVLVQLTTLHKGSLPQAVTAYGTIQPGAAASRTIMAPLPALVESLEVQPGQTVTQGAPLLRLAPSPAAAASYTQAESALQVATGLVARTRDMVAQHLATAQQLADAMKARSDARATLRALQAQGAGGVQTLRAPFAAIVTAVSVTPGSVVAEGAALLQLARAQGLVLQAGLVPGEAVAVTAGDKVAVTPLGGGAMLQGTVLWRGAVVQASDGLVQVAIAVPAGQLLLGEMAQASITTGQLTGYVVPHAAILVDDQGQAYIVQAENMTAKKIPVQILGGAGAENVITGALDPAAPLVLSGNHQLDDGMKMRTAAAGSTSAP
ncbi:efflux RND transporter periplasmic adaptor subunit [Acidocella sp.]|uniref:efflux RND transporter periplasmic adaptor subunit n=1 Tax=Acidocella sp. TaxID=50710 RepID=UPI00261DBC13|nr:HlyD family efflux transporter periplasmic adaptor subunit [Acidocella sp.]